MHGGAPGFAHVVARYRNRVPLRDLLATVSEHIRDQPHGWSRREDVGAARDVLLEDVVLNRAAQGGGVGSLGLGDRNVHGQ